jgi:citrate lyase beta subunit
MSIHNLLADGKTDTRPWIFVSPVQTLEGLKDLVQVLLFETDSVVLNKDLASPVVLLAEYPDARLYL